MVIGVFREARRVNVRWNRHLKGPILAHLSGRQVNPPVMDNLALVQDLHLPIELWNLGSHLGIKPQLECGVITGSRRLPVDSPGDHITRSVRVFGI